jgi:hypothetical protein
VADRTEELERLWQEHGGGIKRIATAMGLTLGQISGRSRILGLQFHGGRARVLARDNQRAVEGQSVFRHRVVRPDLQVLKPGDNQRKLGSRVTKGDWRGMPIYSLTLEERATCPRSCKLWFSCYGNNMGMARRYQAGEALETRLFQELEMLQQRRPSGFVVRLHILGDFYSPAYVKFWAAAVTEFPALHIFGYTAWGPHTKIGRIIARVRDRHWERFAVRTSGASTGPRTVVVSRETPGTIMCPAQNGKTKNCGSCGLCWAPAIKDRPIAFLQH